MIKTSATGDASSRAGFTLLEILLVLFLIGLLSTLFIANIDSAFRREEEATVEHAFWDASREARLQALLTRQPVVLTYDVETLAFQLTSGGASLGSFPGAGTTQAGDAITVQFVQERASNELVLIRGRIVDTRPIDYVVFYPDGSSTSFWVELHFGAATRQIRIDPWTGAEILSQAQ